MPFSVAPLGFWGKYVPGERVVLCDKYGSLLWLPTSLHRKGMLDIAIHKIYLNIDMYILDMQIGKVTYNQ